MMDSQPEFFEEDFPQMPSPHHHFVRLDRKIIPVSFWKDGRMRADLSEYGEGEIVSRNRPNLLKRIQDKLAIRDKLANALAEADQDIIEAQRTIKLETETQRLRNENAAKDAQLAAKDKEIEKLRGAATAPAAPSIAQAVNVRAVAWACEQTDLRSPIAKAVLLIYAIHADSRGYSWPSAERVASMCCIHRTVVYAQISHLLDRRKLLPTKKRRGTTGQVKVYRLPKFTWGSVALDNALKDAQSVGKESGKSRESVAQSDTNNEQVKKEQSLSLQLKRDFVGPPQTHIKWPEFYAYAKKTGKPITGDWFWNWLAKQKPQWRTRPAPPPEEESGWVLDGKWFTDSEATELGIEKPELQVKFRRAVKRAGTIHILESNRECQSREP